MPGGGEAHSQQAQAGFTEQIGGVVQARPCRPSCVSSLLRPDSAASRPWQATTKQLGAEGSLKALAFTGLDPYVMRAFRPLRHESIDQESDYGMMCDNRVGTRSVLGQYGAVAATSLPRDLRAARWRFGTASTHTTSNLQHVIDGA